jgi:hypothetical protein
MNALCDGALSVLEQTYAEDHALFPYTTRLVRGELQSLYGDPMAIRCTINCLVGLQEAARHGSEHPFVRVTDARTARFLKLHEDEIVTPADHGLLLLLLSGGQVGGGASARFISRIRTMVLDAGQVRRMNSQDVSWLLWGTVAAAQAGLPEAEQVARRLFAILTEQFLSIGAALPSHESKRGRFGVVSFGASVYFLRALYEYGTAFDDRAAMGLFRRGVAAVLLAQGPNGEWPWLMNNSDGRPLDVYPVFSVHQDSMSMLFLSPALTDGIDNVRTAMISSMRWLVGKNQLGVSMVQRDPFFIYRSLERRAHLRRAERFARALRVKASGERAELVPNDKLVINQECRSYELGWVLYALSGSQVVAGMDEAE